MEATDLLSDSEPVLKDWTMSSADLGVGRDFSSTPSLAGMPARRLASSTAS